LDKIKIFFSLTPSLSQWERVSEVRVRVMLKVFDVLGREVATLEEGELDAGEHEVVFEAAELPSGIYFAQLQSHLSAQQIKMILMR
jgi:hypothetical protein